MKSTLSDKWEKITFDNIFNFEKKSTIKAGEGKEDGKYKFFTSSDVQSKFIDRSTFDGEYLIFSTGGKAGIHYCKGKFSTSTDCFVVKVDKIIETKYVYYFLRGNMMLLETGFKGAGLKHISKEYLKNIQITYPEDKISQKDIISFLEKIENLKDIQKDADELTQKLLGSVFIDMFGDPVKNTKKWKTYTVREISNKISDGPFGSNLKTEHYTSVGIRVIRLQNIGVEKWLDVDKAYVSKEHYNSIKKHTCEPNDVVVATMGVPNLRACILPTKIKIAINKADCVQIRPNKKFVTSKYLCSLINNPNFVFYASSFMHGQTRTRINMSQVASLKIPIPPIELQEKYGKIVLMLDLVKKDQEFSGSYLEHLFQDSMQKAFKGELV
jgi:type I restriction enzyme, S subunit